MTGDGAGIADPGVPGAVQEFAIHVGGARLVLGGGDAGLSEVGADALAVDLSVIAPGVTGPPLAGIGVVVEVVKRIRRCRLRCSRNRPRWIASCVEEALDGDVRWDRIGEVPALGECGWDGNEFGGWQAGFQVNHGVPAGFIVVGPQDDRGGAIQERVDHGTLNPLGAALPGEDDVGREELGCCDGGFLALYDEDGVVRAPGEEVEVEEGDGFRGDPALPAPVTGVEEVRGLVFGREEPKGPHVLGAVGEVEADDVGVDRAVSRVVGPRRGAVAVGLGGVVAMAVLEGVERAGSRLVIVADTEEIPGPLGGLGLGVDVVLADEFEEIAALASCVVVPQALLGAGEFDVAGVAGVAEDVADDPLVGDLAAGWEELSAEFCDADGECVREFGEGHACSE